MDPRGRPRRHYNGALQVSELPDGLTSVVWTADFLPDDKQYVNAHRRTYCFRVSTDKQTVENQISALTKIAKARGWQVVETYSDAGMSERRP